jgi:hypothetical protein
MAMPKYLKVIIGVSAMALCAFGCSKAQEEFLAVQVCVVDETGVAQLKNIMRAVAKSENLEFIDNSAETGRALKDIGADKALKRDAALAIDVHIEGDRGMGVTAGNLGLPSNQVALGFTAGANAAKARKLADHLIRALSQRWRVQTVPKGQGSFPMSSCGD